MLGCCQRLFLFLRETIIKSVVVYVVVVFRGPVPQHRRSGEQADRDECDCSSRRAFGRRSTRKHTTTRESLSLCCSYSLSLFQRALSFPIRESKMKRFFGLRKAREGGKERERAPKKKKRGEKRKRKKSVACLSLEAKGVVCRRVRVCALFL